MQTIPGGGIRLSTPLGKMPWARLEAEGAWNGQGHASQTRAEQGDLTGFSRDHVVTAATANLELKCSGVFLLQLYPRRAPALCSLYRRPQAFSESQQTLE